MTKNTERRPKKLMRQWRAPRDHSSMQPMNNTDTQPEAFLPGCRWSIMWRYTALTSCIARRRAKTDKTNPRPMRTKTPR